MFKRVYDNNLIAKYGKKCLKIKALTYHFCKPDFTDRKNYLYDFENGFVAFVDCGQHYQAIIGILGRDKGLICRVLKCLRGFMRLKYAKPLIALVDLKNRQCMHFINAVAFFRVDIVSVENEEKLYALYMCNEKKLMGA